MSKQPDRIDKINKDDKNLDKAGRSGDKVIDALKDAVKKGK